MSMSESVSVKNTMTPLTANDKAVLDITIGENPYIPHDPFLQQVWFLCIQEEEGLYGGQAGGGKSDALLMAALQYVEEPDYAALLIRRTYKDLSMPGALMSRAKQWLANTNAQKKEGGKHWEFPDGGTLTFAHLQHRDDVENYQGSEFQFIGFDELTQFDNYEYSYLHSRLRKLEGSQIPIRMRGGSNPGGQGHQWVKDQFVQGDKSFIPAGYKDNPYLNRVEYEKALDKLDWITRQQLKYGNWDINPKGALFKREWFGLQETLHTPIVQKVRFWDLASTLPKPGTDPDYTVGILIGIDKDRVIYVLDVKRVRETPLKVEQLILHTAGKEDGQDVMIRMEQEGGASGQIVIDHYKRKLVGYNFKGERPTRSKEDRAKPVSSYAEGGFIKVLQRPWTQSFLDEVEAFKTEGIHDDQVDALSGGFHEVIQQRRRVHI